eukprot:scaffold66584_cov56-Cyclotella_meneghiniana.AAC.5
MMRNAENLGLSDEQWGSRKNRSSIDAAMLKLLMFETARIKKATLAGTFYDLVANYDRIFPSISNFIARRSSVNQTVLKARALVIERMRRGVKTGLGTSDRSYMARTQAILRWEGKYKARAMYRHYGAYRVTPYYEHTRKEPTACV